MKKRTVLLFALMMCLTVGGFGAAAAAQSPCGIVADTYPGTTGSRVRGLTTAFGGSMLFNATDATRMDAPGAPRT